MTLTPEERAYHDALADAVDMGIYGEDALRHADRMRNTTWFGMRVLHYAGVDLGAALRQSAGRVVDRVRTIVTR